MDLKREFDRLFHPTELATMVESYRLVTDTAFKIFYEHSKLGSTSDFEEDANLLFQMTSMKSLAILKLTESINHTNSIDGVMIKNMQEPFSMSALVRTQYEAFCNFNNIYIQSKNQDELKLKYHLWVISGLNYRQRFGVTGEQAKKQAEEKKKINVLEKLILNNPSYLALDVKYQTNIQDEGIKKKSWQYKIDGKKAYPIAWHEMMTNSGANDLLNHLYTSLSFNSHPSNVSVFQFKDIHDEENRVFLTKMALMLSKVFISMFIRDYCEYFQSCKQTFGTLPEINQALINCYNRAFRSDSFVVSDVGKSFKIN